MFCIESKKCTNGWADSFRNILKTLRMYIVLRDSDGERMKQTNKKLSPTKLVGGRLLCHPEKKKRLNRSEKRKELADVLVLPVIRRSQRKSKSYWHVIIPTLFSFPQCKIYPDSAPGGVPRHTSVWKSPSWTSSGRLTHFSHSVGVMSRESFAPDSSMLMVA